MKRQSHVLSAVHAAGDDEAAPASLEHVDAAAGQHGLVAPEASGPLADGGGTQRRARVMRCPGGDSGLGDDGRGNSVNVT